MRILVALACALALGAQTRIDLRYARAPINSGTTVPAGGGCINDSIFFKTDATAGQNIYVCIAGAYVQQIGGATGPAGPAGSRPFVLNISSATSTFIPNSQHGLNTKFLIVKMFYSLGVAVEPGNIIIDPTTYAVTVTTAVAQTGSIQIFQGNGYSKTSVGSQSSMVIPATEHRLTGVSVVECFNSSNTLINTLIGVGTVTFTPAISDMGGYVSNAYDVVVALATPQAFYCNVIQ